MAHATVFVDDAVRGRLPALCAKDGVPTADRVRVSALVGDRTSAMGVLWLLLLAGPIGWIAFVLIAASRNGRAERVTVEVPMSEASYRRMQALRRVGRWAAVVAFGGAGLTLLTIGGTSLLSDIPALFGILLLVGGIVTSIVYGIRRERASVGVLLDGSRRWVTLLDVHPVFAAACEEQERRRDLERR